MYIAINSAEDLEVPASLDGHIHKKLAPLERHFGDRLTRVEVYLKDVNAGKGGIDKTCTMEARPAGLEPVAVEAQEEDLYNAVTDAQEKLERAVAHRIGRAGS